MEHPKLWPATSIRNYWPACTIYVKYKYCNTYRLFLADINECDAGNGGCNQTCNNEMGTFSCSCKDGFLLGDDAFTCNGRRLYLYTCTIIIEALLLDINECENNNGGCNHTCHNENGTFSCTCDTGYTLNNDGLACDGEILVLHAMLHVYMCTCM